MNINNILTTNNPYYNSLPSSTTPSRIGSLFPVRFTPGDFNSSSREPSALSFSASTPASLFLLKNEDDYLTNQIRWENSMKCELSFYIQKPLFHLLCDQLKGISVDSIQEQAVPKLIKKYDQKKQDFDWPEGTSKEDKLMLKSCFLASLLRLLILKWQKEAENGEAEGSFNLQSISHDCSAFLDSEDSIPAQERKRFCRFAEAAELLRRLFPNLRGNKEVFIEVGRLLEGYSSSRYITGGCQTAATTRRFNLLESLFGEPRKTKKRKSNSALSPISEERTDESEDIQPLKKRKMGAEIGSRVNVVSQNTIKNTTSPFVWKNSLPIDETKSPSFFNQETEEKKPSDFDQDTEELTDFLRKENMCLAASDGKWNPVFSTSRGSSDEEELDLNYLEALFELDSQL